MMKSTQILLVVVPALAAGAAVLYAFLPRDSGAGRTAPQKPNGALSATATTGLGKVTALGRFEPKDGVIGIGAPAGERLDRLEVTVGQRVATGFVLAYLESHGERQAERDHAEARLVEARAQLVAETAYGEALVNESELNLQRLKNTGDLDIAAEAARLRVLTASATAAARGYRRVEGLNRTVVSEEELDRKKLEMQRSEDRLAGGRATLERMTASHDIGLLTAEAQLETAKAALPRSQTAVLIASLEKSLQITDARLQRTIIRAPRDGQIVKVFTWPGETIGNEPILQLGETDQMFAVAEVYETDIRHVRIGQAVRVTSSAFSETLTGTVDQIGMMIYKNDVLSVDPTAAVDARVVEVQIRLNESDAAARLIHLQVDVEIDTGANQQDRRVAPSVAKETVDRSAK